MPGITYQLGLDSTPLRAGLAGALGALNGLAGSMAAVAGTAGLAAGLAATALAVVGFKKAIGEAAKMEGFETSFEVLLGSAEAAKKRMQELAKFAAATPFELPEVAAASRTLETLTKGALSTGTGLALVGDIASATQQPFAEIAMWVGRLYDGLQSGRPIGEAMMRMQELGAISGEARTRIEAMVGAGQKGDAVWGQAAVALGRFGGMMEKQSRTWNGLMSTLSDNVNAAFREFGAPLLDELRPMLSDAVGLVESLAPMAREAGQALAGAVSTMRGLMADGQLGEALNVSLRLGLAQAGNFAVGLFAGIAEAFGSLLASGIKIYIEQLKVLTTVEYWRGMLNALTGVAVSFVAVLTEGIGKVLAGMSRVKGFGWLGGTADTYLQGAKAEFKLAGDAFKAAGVDLAPIADDFWKQFKEAGGKAWDALKDNIGNSDVFGAGSLQTELNKMLAEARAAAQAGKVGHLDADPEFNPALGGKRPEISSPVRGKSESLSDQLARVGGFIGGSGGPRGQKAAEDTARNTAATVAAVKEATVAIKGIETGKFR